MAEEQTVAWFLVACPRCGGEVYYPEKPEPAVLVTCGGCGFEIPVAQCTIKRVEAPPAAIQMMYLIDEETEKLPLDLPPYLLTGHPSLVRVVQRVAWLNRFTLPVQEWLLDVLEEPTTLGSVRVFHALRATQRQAAWGWSWRLRQSMLRPRLPLAVTADAIVGALPALLTIVAVLGHILLELTAYPKALRYMPLLRCAQFGTVACGLLSVYAHARLMLIEPGYVVPPRDAAADPLPADRSPAAMRRAGRCPTCHVRRPPRAGHCKACGLCVDRYDHHCHVLGQCIGRRNYGAFIVYLCLALPACLCALAWQASLVGLWPTDADAPVWHSARRGVLLAMARIVVFVVCTALALPGAVFTAMMMTTVVVNLKTGKTAREISLAGKRNWLRMEHERIRQQFGEAGTTDVQRQLADLSDAEGDGDARGCLSRCYAEVTGKERRAPPFSAV